MKRFRFPLRPVAVLRAHRELLAREAFAAAVQSFSQAREHLAAARGRVRSLEKILLASRDGRFLAADATTLLQAYRAECQRETEAGRALVERRDAMWKRRSDYIEAHRQFKVVSRLEEKARARNQAENARAEQAELDEFAGQSLRRRPVLS